MKSSLILAGAGLTTVLAAPFAGTQVSKQVAKYDDIEDATVLVAGVIDDYQYLQYTAFGAGRPINTAPNLQPSSPYNYAVAPTLREDQLATPEISVASGTISFDLESVNNGCYVATHQGAATPGISCTIRYTGTKINGDQVTFDSVYKTNGLVVGGIGVTAQKVAPATFPKTFKGLISVKPEIVTLGALPVNLPGATGQLAIDDLAYTAYVRK